MCVYISIKKAIIFEFNLHITNSKKGREELKTERSNEYEVSDGEVCGKKNK